MWKVNSIGEETMIQLPEILVADGASVILLSMLNVQARHNRKNRLMDEKLFMLMVNILLFQSILEAVVFLVDGKLFFGARMINIIGNCIYFILNALLPFVWVLYADYKVHVSEIRTRKVGMVFCVPIILFTLTVLTTQFTHVVYKITEDNVYVRSTCFPFFYLLIFFYLIYGLFIIFLKRKTTGKNMVLPLFLFMMPIFLGIIIQYLFYGISTVCISIAVGLVGVYISAQSASYYVDRLSGLYNRSYLDDYLSNVAESKRDHSVVGIMIDMDKFKEINDTYGHHVGDEAIVKAGELFKKHLGDNGFVTRYGGDEFIIITRFSKKAEARELVENIYKEADLINSTGENLYKLEFSYGIAEFHADREDNDSFLRRMDRRMYVMKKGRREITNN